MTKRLAILGFATGLALAQNSGGFESGVYSIGGGVTAPQVLTRVEPQYSAEARAAKIHGEVWLAFAVDANGVPWDIKITRKLGYGLDQEAIAAVKQWRFKPGMKNGQPVPVKFTIAVPFYLDGRPPETPGK